MLLFRELATLVAAKKNCEKAGNTEWYSRHTDRLLQLVKEYMPSGSGVDNGTQLDIDNSSASKLEFLIAYHNMNEAGYYDGWLYFRAIVTGSLTADFDLQIIGKGQDLRDYIYDLISDALRSECPSERTL